MSIHIRVWIGILILVMLATPLVASEKQLRANAGHELELMRAALGNQDTNAIVRTANGIYAALYVQTGVVDGLQNRTSYESERKSAGRTLGDSFYHFTTAANNYLLSLIILTYITILRLVMIAQWLPFMVPFLLAAAIDGIAQHKILHSSVAVSNPVKLKLALHGLVAGLALPLLYLLSPFAITPYFMLGWAIAVAFPLMVLLSEMAPMSYR